MMNRSGSYNSYDPSSNQSLPSRPFVRDVRPNSGILGARDLTGDSVYDAEGEYVGQMVQIMVDTRIGYVAWAVVAVGGFMGIGRRRLAIPWSMVTPDARYKRCSLTVDQDQLLGVSRFSA
jgi:sporulation protein YlmC with PRC-barrel domain